MSVAIANGDCRDVLAAMPDESVHCIVTSPPYFGLRDYGTGRWVGGDSDCKHVRLKLGAGRSTIDGSNYQSREIYKHKCGICGAERVDAQIGLEQNVDDYVNKLVAVFREARRVLRDDGTLWLNLGDSYCGVGGRSVHQGEMFKNRTRGKEIISRSGRIKPDGVIKTKDLIGVPWRVAFALQADGWYLRQDIVWSKPNPIPESVKDRCTRAHEFIFMLSKSERYYYDHEAIKEPAVSDHASGNGFKRHARKTYQNADNSARGNDSQWVGVGGLRNKRDVWTVPVKPFKEAHFATFPPDLIEPCILAGCPPDGVVLDPFLGAGTTGKVAEENGRHCVGIELNPEYVGIAERRIYGDRLPARLLAAALGG